MHIKCCKCNNYGKRCEKNKNMERYDITMDQLVQMEKIGAVIIDIRSPQEYSEGHLKNAIVIPDYEIKRRIFKMIPNKNQMIIVYCGTGIRSKNVQRYLKQMGYANVYNLYKGTENY